jgi:phenylacetic acid degradation operon negative regulatory protein
MDAPATPSQSIAALLARLKPRAGSLIITVFGDTVVPRGGSIWLGSLIRLLAPLGISERLVRTGVYRLSREGWLASRSRGRKAYYHLTPSGIATFAEADRRIYAAEAPLWDGEWTLMHIPADVAPARRQALKAQLGWSGYGQLSHHLFIHTGRRALAGPGEGVAFHARLADHGSSAAPREIAALAWDLERLNAAYAAFTASFAGLEDTPASHEDAFTLATLMIHEYRRILLRDPQLPEELLPIGWAGHGARALAARLYRHHAVAAGCFVAAHMQSWQGLAPAPTASYFGRFGGSDGSSRTDSEAP